MRSNLFLFFLLIGVPSSLFAQIYQRILVDESDPISGYYSAIQPANQQIDGVLFLLPGFGQPAESIIPESKLPNVAFVNNLLTILCVAGSTVCLVHQQFLSL